MFKFQALHESGPFRSANWNRSSAIRAFQVCRPPFRIVIVGGSGLELGEMIGMLERQPDMKVAGVYESAEAVLAEAPWGEVDILVVDLSQPEAGGMHLIESAAVRRSGIRSMVLTSECERETILRAFRAGVSGYVIKGGFKHEVVKGIRDLAVGGVPASPQVTRILVEEVIAAENTSNVDDLTTREIELLRLMADGFLYKEIADRLTISRHTVHSHVKRIYAKLGASRRSEAIGMAQDRGCFSVKPQP